VGSVPPRGRPWRPRGRRYSPQREPAHPRRARHGHRTRPRRRRRQRRRAPNHPHLITIATASLTAAATTSRLTTHRPPRSTHNTRLRKAYACIEPLCAAASRPRLIRVTGLPRRPWPAQRRHCCRVVASHQSPHSETAGQSLLLIIRSARDRLINVPTGAVRIDQDCEWTATPLSGHTPRRPSVHSHPATTWISLVEYR